MGTPHEIYHQPKSAFVADFIGESNFIEVEVGAGGKAALDNGAEVPAPEPRVSGPATLMVRPESIRVHVSPTRTEPDCGDESRKPRFSAVTRAWR